MNVLGLFDGISCGQLALQKANLKVNNYYASEIDKYAIQVTQKNYPNTIQLGDIKLIDNDNLKNLPKIDLLLGGSPCQDISNMKINGQGLKGNKSSLFYEYIRILNWIKENNNCDIKFLLENVVGKKEETNTITEILNVKPLLLNSNIVSGQNRKRYYWTNINVTNELVNKNINL